MAKIERAHTLIVKIGADTAEALADELRDMAYRLERGELTAGISGSPSVGSTYSYRVRPEQTHAAYFRQIEDWLAKEAADAEN